MTTRTRFAPSPTGYLHVGGARTALYAWLYAKHTGGEFVLRIEDTDTERSTDASIQAILDGMNWLNLPCDLGPEYQMQRLARYKDVVEQLLASGHAYRCTCTRERLDKVREEQLLKKLKPKYDGLCRDKNLAETDEDYVIRFRNPTEGSVTFHDKVYGSITVNNEELDDFILVRTDGVPTYNFAVVVDDMDMGITDVIRGDDHINNTPRQINLYHALGATPPNYAHLPMILGDDGKRLSKRHGAVSVMEYHEQGYLPHALLNYLIRLGWSHGDDEVFSREQMIEYFDLTSINKSAASFNTEKLDWLNQHYLKTDEPQSYVEAFCYQLGKLGIETTDSDKLIKIIEAQRERSKTLKEMAEKSQYFFKDVTEYDEKAASKFLKPEARAVFESLLEQLSAIDAWEAEPIHAGVKAVGAALDLKLGKVAQPLRVALTGNTISPSIDVTCELIGKEAVIARLHQALDYVSKD